MWIEFCSKTPGIDYSSNSQRFWVFRFSLNSDSSTTLRKHYWLELSTLFNPEFLCWRIDFGSELKRFNLTFFQSSFWLCSQCRADDNYYLIQIFYSDQLSFAPFRSVVFYFITCNHQTESIHWVKFSTSKSRVESSMDGCRQVAVRYNRTTRHEY